MVQAYILVQTEVGKAAEVAVRIAAIDGVTQAEDVTGPYDVIVRAEAANVDDLGRLVVAQIQAVSGITRTLTCPIVSGPATVSGSAHGFRPGPRFPHVVPAGSPEPPVSSAGRPRVDVKCSWAAQRVRKQPAGSATEAAPPVLRSAARGR